MSYIVVDTEKSSGYLTASKEHATLQEAMDHYKGLITEMATDYGDSVAHADWASDGLWVFQVVPPGELVGLTDGEPLFMVNAEGSLYIQGEETLEDHPPRGGIGAPLQPLREVCNRLDGSIQFSHNTPEPE